MSTGRWLLVVAGTAVICLWLEWNRGSRPVADLDAKIAALDVKLDKLLGATSAEDGFSPLPTDTEVRTAADAKQAIKKLGTTPGAEKLAAALAAIDAWTVKPEQEKEFREYKLTLAAQLRKSVKGEVVALQKAALDAAAGSDGAKKHSEAGRILALYPMSEDKAVIEEAKLLSSQQGELAVRLEVIRRQRYNHWAAERIEAAIDGYNSTASRVPYRTDREKLVASLVDKMGAVDPALLEPTVLDLYNYVVDLTKGALYEAEKITLAKQMTDPTISRKTLGDF